MLKTVPSGPVSTVFSFSLNCTYRSGPVGTVFSIFVKFSVILASWIWIRILHFWNLYTIQIILLNDCLIFFHSCL